MHYDITFYTFNISRRIFLREYYYFIDKDGF